MKPILTLLLLCSLIAFRPQAPALKGAWTRTEDGRKTMLILSDNYAMMTSYEPAMYLGTRGGVVKLEGNKVQFSVEFDTQDSTAVGRTETYQVNVAGNQLTIQNTEGESESFQLVDDGAGQMAGLWRITGREGENGQITTMQRGPRKTLKLLTGTRFQWAAINPQTRQFFGTGGGNYTVKDGKYTETIDFFSRDNSRVGKSLTFNCELKGTDWLHRGQSSTGGRVAEVWSRE